MSRANDVMQEQSSKLELGVLICKVCNDVVATLSTNGVKKIYGICDEKTCRDRSS